jgi:DNA mismatch endonuclease (patch repair protein)
MAASNQEARSRIMASVHGENTGAEALFFQALRDAGLKGYSRHPKGILGHPDAIFRKQRVAVFVDGCFWHGCPRHLRRPAANAAYWQQKIDGNVLRDRRNRAALRRLGWSVIRAWEHELKQPSRVVERLRRALDHRA